MDHIDLVSQIDLTWAWQFLQDPQLGAHGYFLGLVRNQGKGEQSKRKVLYLEFEAYKPMVMRELRLIIQELREKLKIEKVLVLHTLGRKYPGDPVVFIGISAQHRRDALVGCAELIDLLKQRVPIWKKEYFQDGSHWVENHP